MGKLISPFVFAAGLAVASLGLSSATSYAQWGKEPAEEQGPVIVELFTSQGCSSCPAADSFLAELAKRPNVIALSLSVDYWDYLGWRDTLALPEHTKRQYSYAEKLGTKRPYTPEVVVDGRYDCVGSDTGKINSVIRRFLKAREPRVPVTVNEADGTIFVSVGAKPATKSKKRNADTSEATVWLVRYEPHHNVPVARGENKGHTLTYTNVVRDWMPLGMWIGKPITFRLAHSDLNAEGSAFAVLVQEMGTGPIVGAAHFRLAGD